MACRDGVAALLSALASLDLRLFLQVLGRRCVAFLDGLGGGLAWLGTHVCAWVRVR